MTTTVPSPARDRERSPERGRPALRLGRTLVWVLLAGAVISVALAAFRAPFDFDAAYNLQVPRNLAHGHGYATDGALDAGRRVAFDHRISTGPTLLLPVAGALVVLGDHVWVYPVVPVLAWLGAVVLAAKVGRRLGGTGGDVAGAASVVMLATAASTWPDSPVFGVGDVLGEYLAAAFLLGAALSLARPKLVGSLLGLAVLTKFLMVLAVPAFVLAVVWPRGRRTPRAFLASTREHAFDALMLLATLMMPVLVWNGLKVATVGVRGTAERGADFVHLLTHAGSGIGASRTHSRGPTGQLGLLVGLVPPVVGLLLLGVVLVVLVLVLRPGLVESGAPVVGRPLEVTDVRLTVALVGSAATMLAWWTLISSAPYVRHVLPAAVIALPVGVGLLLRSARRRGLVLVPVVLTASLLVGAGSHAVTAWQPPGPSRAEQQAAARGLAGTRELGWSRGTPVLELGVFGDFDFPATGKRSGVLVLGPVTARLHPGVFERESRRCREVLERTEHYLACRVDAR